MEAKTQNQQQQTPQTTNGNGRPTVTLEIVKAKFNKELTALDYQKALDRFKALTVTMENVASVQESLKRVRAFLGKLQDIKEQGKKEALAECRMWDAAYNDVYGSLNELLIEKSNELQKIVNKIDEENKKKEAERLRIEGINKEIDDFILQTSAQIAGTVDTDELIAIEKLIGSHKANKSRYQEFLPDLVSRCNELVPMIKKQKEHIAELEKIAKAKKKAEKKGDDKALLELMEKETAVKDQLDEKKIQIQETAINQATRPSTTVVPETTNLSFRRKQWKWEVKDVKELYKKMPHLVDLVPNKEKIDDLLRTKKADDSLKDTEEVIINGIRFYLDKKA